MDRNPDKYDGAAFQTYAGRDKDGKEVHIDSVGICQMLDAIRPSWMDDYDRTWEEDCAELKAYCKKHDALYYAKPRENFSVWEGVHEAIKAGKTVMVVEDMS